jgi:hypothetical protein
MKKKVMKNKYDPSKKEIAKGNAEIAASKNPKKVVRKLNNKLKAKRKGY